MAVHPRILGQEDPVHQEVEDHEGHERSDAAHRHEAERLVEETSGLWTHGVRLLDGKPESARNKHPLHLGSSLTDLQDLRVAIEPGHGVLRSEEHTSELQSLMRISYAVF